MKRAFLLGSIALVTFAAMPLPGRAAAESRTAPVAVAVGEPVAEVLERLAENGARVIWSSLLVPPALVVVAAPAATDAAELLAEILAPHGLAVAKSGETLIVVREATAPPAGAAAGATASLSGTVRSRPSLEPVAGARVRLAGSDRETSTDESGAFDLSGLPAGPGFVEVRRPGFVVEEAVGVELAIGAPVALAILLQPAPLAADEIVVQPSRLTLLLEEPTSPFALSREEIGTLPHLAGDVFRALDLLPGAVANDVSAEIHVRGGRRDETLILLDGQEIFDAYHLKDFDNALSVVPASTLEQLSLATGALPANLGDRLGAALELTTLSPAGEGHFRLGISLLDLQLETANQRGGLSWLASARYGSAALAGALFDEEDPSFWDLYLKGSATLGERQSLRASVLATADELDFAEGLSGERRHFVTEYGNQYLWMTHQAVLSDRLFVDSGASYARFDRDRRGLEDEEEKFFTVRDERDTRVVALLQSWAFEPLAGHTLAAGFEARRYDSLYDYASFKSFHTPMAELRAEPRDGAYVFADRVRDEAIALYLSDRMRPGENLTLELGGRFDRHTGSDATVWSPRAAAAWRLGGMSVLRLAWGRHAQSQRSYELMIPDGDSTFYPGERGTHSAIGFEHRFAPERGRFVDGVRAEVYDHHISNPRPRYESLFEPFEPFVEGELDRVRIEPEEARAQGVELFVHGRPTPRFGWWVNYAYARSEDLLDGRWTPRQVDQRHTFNADLTLRLGERWDLNLAWRFHTGRPTTAVALELEPIPHEPEEPGEPPDDGEPEELGGLSAAIERDHELELHPGLGPLNAERLEDYHRLDLRLSRELAVSAGQLLFYVDVQNLYNRQNVAGFDLEIDEETPGGPTLIRNDEAWPGFLASAGISWKF